MLLCVKSCDISPDHVYINHPYLVGVGVFPSQDPAQSRMPPWIYNESLVPGKVKLLCPTFPSGYFTLSAIEIFLNTVVVIKYAEEIVAYTYFYKSTEN